MSDSSTSIFMSVAIGRGPAGVMRDSSFTHSMLGGIAIPVPEQECVSDGSSGEAGEGTACRGRHTPCQGVNVLWRFRPGTG